MLGLFYRYLVTDSYSWSSTNGVQIKVCKKTVKEASKKQSEKEIKGEMKTKMEDIKEEKFEMRDYMKTKIIEDARMMFRIRCKMVDVKWNYQNDARYKAELWSCDGCKRTIETQSHVMQCPAYTNLRVGMSLKNDKDIVEYFKRVLEIRQKMRKNNPIN